MSTKLAQTFLDDEALDRLAAMLASRLGGCLAGTTPPEDRWLSAREATAYLSIPISSIWKPAAARDIPCEQDGPRCRLYFRRSELDAWREGTWKR